MKKSFLITRTQKQAQEIVKYLEDNGFETFVEPIFSIQRIDFSDKPLPQKKIQALILTSSNAAKSALDLAEKLQLDKKIKIFTVGKRTAQSFLQAGYSNIIFPAKSSAINLKKIILEDAEINPEKGILLYFCGKIITLDFKKELAKYGFVLSKITSYKILKKQNFSPKFLARAELKFDFILLYSSNSAKQFFELAEKHNLIALFENSKILCLSEKILALIRNFGFKNSTTFTEIAILKKFYD